MSENRHSPPTDQPPGSPPPPELPPRRTTPQSSFIEEEKATPEPPQRPQKQPQLSSLPTVDEQPTIPPALPQRHSITPTTNLPTSIDTATLTTAIPPASITAPNELRHRQQQQKTVIADIVPDLHGIAPSQGLSTDIHTHDASDTRQTIKVAERKSVPPFPGTYQTQQNSRRPDWNRVFNLVLLMHSQLL
ncbi:hypothetical protein BDF20DRAFT_278465 [Mycotypha africana]|uniref:uncharacterized protein n=1 Tax=Mycotypha africana TaxID=64632 RepID=UPI0023017C5F|nr:uncharacterized protein BDF20DRAFT_278465 [Mycotypha africana]KAI8987616.1 hypothetical protein BDF20DRAFT_278465 [Mycotypha africana]